MGSGVRWIHTWQAGTRLHPVRFLSITEAANVETQRPDVIDALSHNQVLVHEIAAVGARLEGKHESREELYDETLLV